MNEKLRSFLILLAYSIMYIFLETAGSKMLDGLLPETFVGLTGLIEVKKYLTVFILFSCFKAFILGFVFYISFGMFAEFSEKITLKYEDRFAGIFTFIISVIISVISVPKCSSFERQCEMLELPNMKIVQSVVLLEKVNKDIRNEKTDGIRSGKEDFVSNKQFEYKRAKSIITEDEFCMSYKDGRTISQVSASDYVFMYSVYQLSDKIVYEQYSESGFLSSFMDIDDIPASLENMKKRTSIVNDK